MFWFLILDPDPENQNAFFAQKINLTLIFMIFSNPNSKKFTFLLGFFFHEKKIIKRTFLKVFLLIFVQYYCADALQITISTGNRQGNHVLSLHD
jgi:hypothetical protein